MRRQSEDGVDGQDLLFFCGGFVGGVGGFGGSVIFQADLNINTLLKFLYKQEITAEHGEAGGKRKQHGKNGTDKVVKVPVGTMVFSGDTLLADLATPESHTVFALGGHGGFGYAHFVSSVLHSP